MRVAYSPRLGYAKRLDPEVETAVTAAARAFEELGAKVEQADPELDGDPIDAWDTLWWSIHVATLLQSFGERVQAGPSRGSSPAPRAGSGRRSPTIFARSSSARICTGLRALLRDLRPAA